MRARKITRSSKRQQRRRFVRPLLCETLESRWLLDNGPLGLDPDRFGCDQRGQASLFWTESTMRPRGRQRVRPLSREQIKEA